MSWEDKLYVAIRLIAVIYCLVQMARAYDEKDSNGVMVFGFLAVCAAILLTL